jgi:4-amino-4-deoxy-L-arabinose transferase-like glycosyltransferase
MYLFRHNVGIAFGVFIYGLVIFTMGLDYQEFIGFESRFYLFALEMWRHGASFFPTTYHEPYADYPATAIYFIYIFSKMVGELDKFTAVFPSALAAALTLSVTYLLGALHSRRWGLAAVFFLLLTNEFVADARTISLDQYTTLITAICFYLACTATELRQYRRLLWIIPLLIFGFAVRGPLGLVIPAGVLCVFYFLEKDLLHFIYVSICAAVLLIICSAILLCLAKYVGGDAFMRDVIQLELAGRLQDTKPQPFYFYFVQSIGSYALTFPLAILTLFGMKNLQGKHREFIKKCLGWVLIIMLGLSLPSDKKIRYILPIAPALALICGYLYFTISENEKILRRVISYISVILPSLCLIALCFISIKMPDIELLNFSLSLFFVSMQILTLVFFWNTKRADILLLFAASFIFIVSYVFIVEPINLQLNQTRDFVERVEMQRIHSHAALVFYGEGKDGLAIKYIVNMPQEDAPIFILNANDLLALNQKIFVVTTEENFQKMPANIAQKFKVVAKGKVGREPFVVLKHQ